MVIAAVIGFVIFAIGAAGASLVMWAILSIVLDGARERRGDNERYIPVYGSREPDGDR